MKRSAYGSWIVVALLVLLVTACGGGAEVTPAPGEATLAPTAAAAAAVDAAQQVSPLANPESPLARPESPLEPAGASAQPAGAQQPEIGITVPMDAALLTQLQQDTTAPTPKEGMASLSGILYSPNINRIIPGTQFYLTPAIEDNGKLYIPTLFVGPKVENGDVLGFSNEHGQITLDNVPPGNYYLAVWTAYNWPLAFAGQQDKLPLLITVKAGEQRDLGVLYVEWP